MATESVIILHLVTSGMNCIELAAYNEFILRYACGYDYKQTHIGFQKPYCCIIWSSNLNVWMLLFSLYFDQYFRLFSTIQQFNVMVFMQVGCLRALHL